LIEIDWIKFKKILYWNRNYFGTVMEIRFSSNVSIIIINP
jgi:hypothetical protein